MRTKENTRSLRYKFTKLTESEANLSLVFKPPVILESDHVCFQVSRLGSREEILETFSSVLEHRVSCLRESLA